MAQIRVTKNDVESLEAKADLAYNVLKMAVETPEPALVSSAECLYKNDLGGYLREITMKSTNNFALLNKGGKRARKLQRYILQYALMTESVSSSKPNCLDIAEDPEDGMGGLKAFIDAEDSSGSVEGEVFRRVQAKAQKLRKDGKHGLILSALDYVRENYSQP